MLPRKASNMTFYIIIIFNYSQLVHYIVINLFKPIAKLQKNHFGLLTITYSFLSADHACAILPIAFFDKSIKYCSLSLVRTIPTSIITRTTRTNVCYWVRIGLCSFTKFGKQWRCFWRIQKSSL